MFFPPILSTVRRFNELTDILSTLLDLFQLSITIKMAPSSTLVCLIRWMMTNLCMSSEQNFTDHLSHFVTSFSKCHKMSQNFRQASFVTECHRESILCKTNPFGGWNPQCVFPHSEATGFSHTPHKLQVRPILARSRLFEAKLPGKVPVTTGKNKVGALVGGPGGKRIPACIAPSRIHD